MSIHCPLCRSSKLIDHSDLQECRTCTHLFQWPPTITAKYDAAYVAKYAHYPVTEISYLRLGYLRAFVNGGTLLDVGHCRGDFVRAARAGGFNSWGYDVHGEQVGVPTIKTLSGDWDVVTFFDSLEHFDSLEPIREFAKRAKLIVVACPCKPQTFPAVREWRHYRPGEHLHYFTTESMARLFNTHRLEHSSNIEDSVRGNRNGQTNIMTLVFSRTRGN